MKYSKLYAIALLLLFTCLMPFCGTKRGKTGADKDKSRLLKYSLYRYKTQYPGELYQRPIIPDLPWTNGGDVEFKVYFPTFIKDKALLYIDYNIKNLGTKEIHFDLSSSFLVMSHTEIYLQNKVMRYSLAPSKELSGQLIFSIKQFTSPAKLYFLFSNKSHFNLTLFAIDDVITI